MQKLSKNKNIKYYMPYLYMTQKVIKGIQKISFIGQYYNIFCYLVVIKKH
jgi:hypothetical protein